MMSGKHKMYLKAFGEGSHRYSQHTTFPSIGTFIFSRTNAENWQDGVLPSAGSSVVFPESFSQFGADRCVNMSSACVKGGVVAISPPASGALAVTLAKITMPLNGKLVVKSGVRVYFAPQQPGLLRLVLWFVSFTTY
jgi:hypothetical protein